VQPPGTPACRRQFVGQRPHLRPANKKAGLRVLQEVVQLVALVGRIERQEHHSGADRGEVEHQRLGRLFHLRRDAVAAFQAERHDQVGHASRGAFDVGVGPCPAVGEDHAGRGIALWKAGGKDRINVLVHVGGAAACETFIVAKAGAE
jgi:hypothetical protein